MPNESSNWPALTRYEGPHLQEIAFPLGGIGTGSFCLGGRADFRDFELFNSPDKGCNPPYTFFALRAQSPGEHAVTRILEGALQPPYRGGGFGAGVPLAGLPRMRNVALDACYPFARYTLSDPDVPLTVSSGGFQPPDSPGHRSLRTARRHPALSSRESDRRAGSGLGGRQSLQLYRLRF